MTMSEENNKPLIRIFKSAYGTIDVVIYNISNIQIVNWFALMDIWSSRGYDRFNDNGLYFELQKEMYDIIPDLPFIHRFAIVVKYIDAVK